MILVTTCFLDNTHKDCRVRRQRVLDAIMWLKGNNTYYKDIIINHDALQQLPEDDVPSGLQVMEENDEDEEQDPVNPLKQPAMMSKVRM